MIISLQSFKNNDRPFDKDTEETQAQPGNESVQQQELWSSLCIPVPRCKWATKLDSAFSNIPQWAIPRLGHDYGVLTDKGTTPIHMAAPPLSPPDKLMQQFNKAFIALQVKGRFQHSVPNLNFWVTSQVQTWALSVTRLHGEQNSERMKHLQIVGSYIYI